MDIFTAREVDAKVEPAKRVEGVIRKGLLQLAQLKIGSAPGGFTLFAYEVEPFGRGININAIPFPDTKRMIVTGRKAWNYNNFKSALKFFLILFLV